MNVLVSWKMDAKKQRLRGLAIGAPAVPPGTAVAAAAAAAAAPAQDDPEKRALAEMLDGHKVGEEITVPIGALEEEIGLWFTS